MENTKKSVLRRCADRVFGGVDMKWWKVIVLAVATALVTFLFLVFPVFRGTSFERMGIDFEAWILFAVFIMANCKTPLDSALKTFVFFLVSQPLIYLFQVPFSDMGWGLFGYYRTWFIWTLLTLPMAYVGWYIRRRDWVSLLILSPVIVYLTFVSVSSFRFAFDHFPLMLFTAVFCLLQVVLYLYVFTPKWWMRLLGFLAPLALVAILMLFTPRLQLDGTNFLPGDPVLTPAAVAQADDPDITITVEKTGKDSMIRVRTEKYGSTDFTVTDGDTVYRYGIRIYEDDGGHAQVEITPKN